MTTNGYPTVAHRTPKIWPSVITGILLLVSLAAPAAAQVYTIAPQPYQQPLDDSGNIVVGGCIWTYAAGTTTPIATYTDNTGTLNSNPILADTAGRITIYLLAGTNYKFVYETACTPPAHGSVLKSRDGIAGVPATAANVDFTCTAGEALTAGLAVYMSDGSAGKNQGQCYKADSANTYSSSAAVVVGMVPSAITSGLPGTVRLAGSLPGLSSLSVGSAYYVGTAGAITSTVPANARKLGGADTATSLVLTLPPALPTLPNGIDDFRVSPATASCFPTADVTAVTTIYLTPCFGSRIALPDSAGVTTVYSAAELSIAVPATTSTAYDVFVYANSGVPTLELLVWTNVTTRATAIVRTTTGFYTKSGDLTRRYVASFMTGTVSGQTEDSLAKRYVWNYYNRALRPMFVSDSTGTWTYSSATFQQANANAANQLDFMIGVAEEAVPVRAISIAKSTSAADAVYVGIGLDSTTTQTATSVGQQIGIGVTGTYYTAVAFANPIVAVGRHRLVWLERTAAAGTGTFQGGANSGISGEIKD